MGSNARSVKMKTVLILAYECAPFHRSGSTIGAQRAYQFAKHLPKFGWRTIVMCADSKLRRSLEKEAVDEVIEEIYAINRTEILSAEKITLALPSLRYADFWDRVWISSVNSIPNLGTFDRKRGFFNLIRAKLSSLVKLFYGDHSHSWQEVAYKMYKRISKEVSIDFIISSHGPDASLYVGSRIAREDGVNWGLDFRDLILQPIPSQIRYLYMLHLRKLTRSALFTINVNEYWCTLDQQLFGKPAMVIANGFDEEEFRNIDRDDTPNKLDSITILYPGGIFHPFQKIENFFQVLKGLKEEYAVLKPKINFIYVGNATEYVKKCAMRMGIENDIMLLDQIPRESVMKLYGEADFLLILSVESATDKFYVKGMHPGKFFEYLAARKPVLCLSAKKNLLENDILRLGVGMVFHKPEEMANYIKEWLEFPDRRLGLLPRREEGMIAAYSRENGAKKLAELLMKNL